MPLVHHHDSSLAAQSSSYLRGDEHSQRLLAVAEAKLFQWALFLASAHHSNPSLALSTRVRSLPLAVRHERGKFVEAMIAVRHEARFSTTKSASRPTGQLLRVLYNSLGSLVPLPWLGVRRPSSIELTDTHRGGVSKLPT